MSTLGRIVALWRYPVKSMLGESLSRARIGPDGIPGDRGVAVVDATSERVLSAKREPALLRLRAFARPGGPVIGFPDGRALYAADAADALSEFLGRAVRVDAARGDDERAEIENEDGSFFGRAGGFFDSSALHLVTTGTLERLAEMYAGTFDPRRFRPNIVVQTDEPELDWVGGVVRTGSMRLDVVKACSRCAITSVAQEELPKDRGILSTVARRANNVVGVYLAASETGSISLGDEVAFTSR